MDTFSNARYGAQPSYGAQYAYPTNGAQYAYPTKLEDPIIGSPARKGRINYPALASVLLMPWLLFYVTCWTMSFYVHYERSIICWFVALCGLFAVLFSVGMARQALRRRNNGETHREPTWYIFLAVTMTFAWLLGLLSGSWIYYGTMQPYYDISNLAVYPNVDPVAYQGQQLMDAGRVIFSEGTKVAIHMSAGFKNKVTYCVVPIVSGNPDHSKLASYDFWAVGKDCCSTTKPDFHCGDFHNPNARGGLRLMNDVDRSFYGLAVQQAVSANGIQARMPIFFSWVEDPLGAVKAMQEQGYKRFCLCGMLYFSLQLTLSAVAAVAFAKHGFGYN